MIRVGAVKFGLSGGRRKKGSKGQVSPTPGHGGIGMGPKNDKEKNKPGRPGSGGGGADAHTHWRVRRIQGGTIYLGLAEVNFGHLATGGSVLYSTQFDVTTYPAINAFDGAPSTTWLTSANTNHEAFIGYAFPTPVSVSTLSLTSGPTSNLNNYMITQAALESSDDGVAWTEIWRQEVGTSYSPGQTRTFTVS